MDGKDEQALGRYPWHANTVVFEHAKSQANDEDWEGLQIKEAGKEKVEATRESGDFKLGVADGASLLTSHVQTSKTFEEASPSLESSYVAISDSRVLSSGECSNSLRGDTPTGGVRSNETICQFLHREIRSRGGNAEAFNGDDVKHATCHTTPSVISEEDDALCLQDWSTHIGCPYQHGGSGNHGEGEDCRVVFERNLSFGNRDSSPDMDETIWQSLPEDVEDKILAWLPVASFVRFRSVCKRWYNLINSERFAQMHSRSAAHETWILSFGNQSSDPAIRFMYMGQVFDPVSCRSFMLEFPFLPENSIPVASAGGLVCFCCDSSSYGESDVSFYVCNPITKAWKFIPSPCSRVSIVTLIVDAESDFLGYKLYVFCEASAVRWLWVGLLDHSTKEYDSKLNRWKDIGGIHSGEQFKSGSVFTNGKVHLLSPELVEALDVHQGNWIEMDRAPAYASCATLLQREDRLLVVGDMVHHNVFHLPNLRSYVGIVIWEFDPVTKDWIEVSRMPDTMVDNFSYSSFSCVIVGDVLYLFSRSYSLPCIITYSFPQQLWTRESNMFEEAVSKVFTFNPRLDACA